MNLDEKKMVYFIGIGGVGMSALANILLSKGISVAGSDIKEIPVFEYFRKQGALVHIGHDANQVDEADLVVYSTAIHPDNPELVQAKKLGIEIIHRSELVAVLLNSGTGIAVAGAHGKTTTTSMIGQIFEYNAQDPTVIIGGEVDYLNGNSKLGAGEFVIAEADESDGSFLRLFPRYAVITNIEDDHLDFYGSFDNIKQAFLKFGKQILDQAGFLVVCTEDKTIQELKSEWPEGVVSYGFMDDADYCAKNIIHTKLGTEFDVYKKGICLGRAILQMPGEFNVLNGLAAIVIGLISGLTFSEAVSGLAQFSGTKRRFQTLYKGEMGWVVDDYAHHPTEIKSTLRAAKMVADGRLICAFQPHRYTRTDLLRDEFASSFDDADLILFVDIYAAGESPIDGVDGELLPRLVKRRNNDVLYIKSTSELVAYLSSHIQMDDLVITMGAGNITECGHQLANILKGRSK